MKTPNFSWLRTDRLNTDLTMKQVNHPAIPDGILEKKTNFEHDLETFLQLEASPRSIITREDLYPCLDDATETTDFDHHYLYHPAWAARIIKMINPAKHIDISSTLAFSSIFSAVIPIDFYDFRTAKLTLSGLKCGVAELTDLHFESGSISSISCMHTIEHVGLGRYGDPLDANGDLKAIQELKRVTAPGGNLLIVVQVGRPSLQFNAHRIYSYEMILEYFQNFELLDFSLILDDGDFIEKADPALVSLQSYGCGCFWFKKEVS
jgi:SAM-dependent methyltransferase